MNIYSKVAKYEQTDFISTAWESVAAEYVTKIFAPTDKYNCQSIQRQLLSDVISNLDSNQARKNRFAQLSNIS